MWDAAGQNPIDASRLQPVTDVGLRVEGAAAVGRWGAYRADHTYTADVTAGASGPVVAYYRDMPGYYGDNSGSLTLSVYVDQPNRPPVVSTTAPAPILLGSTLGTQAFSATDADGDPLSVTTSGLPAGVSCGLTTTTTGGVTTVAGTLTGTPTVVGLFTVTVTADDMRTGGRVRTTFNIGGGARGHHHHPGAA